MQPTTAIVILNWNGRSFLEQFLPPLLASLTGPETEVIIADNGSTDDSVAFLRERYPQLRLILFEQNWGYTGGYNRALAQIEAAYYILLNSDVQVTAGWLEPLVSFMESRPQTAICMPKIRALAQPESFEYAGACGGFIDRFGYPFCRGRILSCIERDHGQYNTPIEVFWASGTCFMIRARLYHELGGLDELFFAHMEEIDLCWRAKLKGHQVWVIPQSQIFHLGGGTLPNDSPRKLYLNYRNNLSMLYKNLPQNRLFITLASRVLLDYMAAFIYLIQAKPTLFASVLRAHHHFWKGRKQLSRKIIQEAQPEALAHLQKTTLGKSIVLAFFLRKRRLTFNRLHF